MKRTICVFFLTVCVSSGLWAQKFSFAGLDEKDYDTNVSIDLTNNKLTIKTSGKNFLTYSVAKESMTYTITRTRKILDEKNKKKTVAILLDLSDSYSLNVQNYKVDFYEEQRKNKPALSVTSLRGFNFNEFVRAVDAIGEQMLRAAQTTRDGKILYEVTTKVAKDYKNPEAVFSYAQLQWELIPKLLMSGEITKDGAVKWMDDVVKEYNEAKEMGYEEAKGSFRNIKNGFFNETEDKGESFASGKLTWQASLRYTMNTAPTRTYFNDRYKGQIVDNQRNHLGAYLWDNNAFYFGNWINGVRTGTGIYVSRDNHYLSFCPSCKYYVGGFSGDKLSGQGTCYSEKGKALYDGKFSEGRPQGEYPSKKDLHNYKFESIDYPSGTRYIGETKNGVKNGYGIFLWPDGNMWYGLWEAGIRKGKGILIYNNGNTRTGYWNDNTYSADED